MQTSYMIIYFYRYRDKYVSYETQQTIHFFTNAL